MGSGSFSNPVAAGGQRSPIPATSRRARASTCSASSTTRARWRHDHDQRHGLRPGRQQPALQRRGLRAERAGCRRCRPAPPATRATACTPASRSPRRSPTPRSASRCPRRPRAPNIPLVVQVGKWRRQFTIPNVTKCQDNPQPDGMLRLAAQPQRGRHPEHRDLHGQAPTRSSACCGASASTPASTFRARAARPHPHLPGQSRSIADIGGIPGPRRPRPDVAQHLASGAGSSDGAVELGREPDAVRHRAALVRRPGDASA